MGKSRPRSTKEIADRDEGSFDASLGLVLGDTWWSLGKNFSPALTGEARARTRYLEQWTTELHQQLSQLGVTEPVGGITPSAIKEFIDTVMMLLEKKYDGDNIARDVSRLTKKASNFDVSDDGQYLDIKEPAEVFWAVEYDFLFSDLGRPTDSKGWLNAVARCEDTECRTFFIKSRSDQRHHTSACRTRARNRQAYDERTGPRPHTKRGRPRLRR